MTAGVVAFLGAAALPDALLAGLLGLARSAPLVHLGMLELISGFAAAFLAAVVAAVVTAEGTAVFFGAAGAAPLGVGVAPLDYGLAAVSLAGAPRWRPRWRWRSPRRSRGGVLAGPATLPPVPRDADELLRDTLTVQGSQVLGDTAAADRVVTGAVAGIGLVAAVVAPRLGSACRPPRVMWACSAARCSSGPGCSAARPAPVAAGPRVRDAGPARARCRTARARRWSVAVILPAGPAAAALAGAGMRLPPPAVAFWGRAAETSI